MWSFELPIINLRELVSVRILLYVETETHEFNFLPGVTHLGQSLLSLCSSRSPYNLLQEPVKLMAFQFAL